MTAFKKQMKLIDILKRQKVCVFLLFSVIITMSGNRFLQTAILVDYNHVIKSLSMRHLINMMHIYTGMKHARVGKWAKELFLCVYSRASCIYRQGSVEWNIVFTQLHYHVSHLFFIYISTISNLYITWRWTWILCLKQAVEVGR